MNRDELLKMLDLTGTDPAVVESVKITSGASPPEPETGGPTALRVDEWGLRRGRDLLAESERLKRLPLDELAVADFHTAAFDPDPELLPSCSDRKRHSFLSQLLETPDYRSLHADTRLDETASSIAAVSFAEEFCKLDDSDGSSEVVEGLESEMATLRAVGRAVTEASKEVEALRETSGAFGMGAGSTGSNDPSTVASLFRRVRSDPNLKRICELAGRYRRVAQSKQRRKAVHGLDDVVGVEPGGDIGRLLPVELARLVVPELELDSLRRIAERQALCREYHGLEAVAKGPIIVCVDESGSMEGDRVHTAKALALAMAWIARQQRRWCGLIAYSGNSGERLLSLPPSRWDEEKLADWLMAFIGKGSTLDVPVRELPRMYAELKASPGDTDVLFITDARCHIPCEIADSFLAWKTSAKARLITLVIQSEPGDLTTLSDEVHLVPKLGVEEEAIERILSI